MRPEAVMSLDGTVFLARVSNVVTEANLRPRPYAPLIFLVSFAGACAAMGILIAGVIRRELATLPWALSGLCLFVVGFLAPFVDRVSTDTAVLQHVRSLRNLTRSGLLGEPVARLNRLAWLTRHGIFLSYGALHPWQDFAYCSLRSRGKIHRIELWRPIGRSQGRTRQVLAVVLMSLGTALELAAGTYGLLHVGLRNDVIGAICLGAVQAVQLIVFINLGMECRRTTLRKDRACVCDLVLLVNARCNTEAELVTFLLQHVGAERLLHE